MHQGQLLQLLVPLDDITRFYLVVFLVSIFFGTAGGILFAILFYFLARLSTIPIKKFCIKQNISYVVFAVHN